MTQIRVIDVAAPEGDRRTRPVVCDAASVRALIEGDLTQVAQLARVDELGRVKSPTRAAFPDAEDAMQCCPMGRPGDLIWLAEQWAVPRAFDDAAVNELHAFTRVFYGINELKDLLVRDAHSMPRWASRMDLVVGRVRLERYRDVTDADAVRRGVVRASAGSWWGAPQGAGPSRTDYRSARDAWMSWQAYRMRQHSLLPDGGAGARAAANPWVWVADVTTERLGGPWRLGPNRESRHDVAVTMELHQGRGWLELERLMYRDDVPGTTPA